jgi:hypothetical protein
MSYDLTLYPRPGVSLTRDEFTAYFTDNEPWSLNGDEANYENEATGVYFHLTHRDGEVEDEASKGKTAADATGPRLWFNINFCRPRFFGREASSVLDAVATDLGLIALTEDGEEIDSEGIGEEMLDQWNRGNDWACRAILAMHGTGTGVHPFPAKALGDNWVWTYQREQMAEDLFDDDIDVFVPRVMYLRHEGKPRSLAVWPNLIPTAVPKVDLVYVARDELPAGKRGRRTRMALVTYDELRAGLPRFKAKKGGPLPYLLLDYGRAEDAPDDVVKYVHGLPSYEGKLQGLAPDKLIDADLMPKGGGKR